MHLIGLAGRCAWVLFFAALFIGTPSALSAPFNLLTVDVGALQGYEGPGIYASSGGFFTADGAGGNVTTGSASTFTAENEYEFDSHFTINFRGPSARGRAANPADNSVITRGFYGDYPTNLDHNDGSVSLMTGPGTHIGDAFGDGDQPENAARGGYFGVGGPSGFAPNVNGGRSPFNGVFIGRLTVQSGATLSGGAYVSTLISAGVFDSHIMLIGGPAVLFRTSPTLQQLLALRAYRIATIDLLTPSASTADGYNVGTPFGLANVYDLWVQTVPGPGAVGMLGALAIPRRRERRAFACAKGS